jgi:hypothetical protein
LCIFNSIIAFLSNEPSSRNFLYHTLPGSVAVCTFVRWIHSKWHGWTLGHLLFSHNHQDLLWRTWYEILIITTSNIKTVLDHESDHSQRMAILRWYTRMDRGLGTPHGGTWTALCPQGPWASQWSEDGRSGTLLVSFPPHQACTCTRESHRSPDMWWGVNDNHPVSKTSFPIWVRQIWWSEFLRG